MSLKKFPQKKTRIPCSRVVSFVSSQTPFPALRHGSNYPFLGTSCDSKLNQTIYLSGAVWLRYIMWFSEELLPSESVSVPLSLLIKKRRDMGVCVTLASLFLFFLQDGSFFTDAIQPSPFTVFFLKTLFSILETWKSADTPKHLLPKV